MSILSMNTDAYADIEAVLNVDDKDSRYIKGATGLVAVAVEVHLCKPENSL
jgi:hypothetical protein